jgi:hypothetical protein
MIDYSPANGSSPVQGRDGANFELIYPGGAKTAGGGRKGHVGFFEGGRLLTAMPAVFHQHLYVIIYAISYNARVYCDAAPLISY